MKLKGSKRITKIIPNNIKTSMSFNIPNNDSYPPNGELEGICGKEL